jgi:hypothetical protein
MALSRSIAKGEHTNAPGACGYTAVLQGAGCIGAVLALAPVAVLCSAELREQLCLPFGAWISLGTLGAILMSFAGSALGRGRKQV